MRTMIVIDLYDGKKKMKEQSGNKNTQRGKQLLEEAVNVIDARGEHYGPPKENFQRIADFWSVYLKGKLKEGEAITPLDHALMMDLVKTARLMETPQHWDSFLDKCGYAAVAVECFDVD